MRPRTILALLVLFACELTADAGRTGQARSAEVLARRQAASPRGPKEWGGKMMAYVRAGQKEVRRDLRRATPRSLAAAGVRGKDEALTAIHQVIGTHLGLTPGQVASKDRRHERAVAKQLRRMLRDVRAARSSRRPFREAFPDSLATGYSELEAALVGEIAERKARQVASQRTR